jgi:WD40-like Beta Propeller Repeat
VYVLDVADETLRKVTFNGTDNGMPVWSPDGRQLAYYSDHVSGGVNIFLRRSDGVGEPEALTTGDGIKVPTSFSPGRPPAHRDGAGAGALSDGRRRGVDCGQAAEAVYSHAGERRAVAGVLTGQSMGGV